MWDRERFATIMMIVWVGTNESNNGRQYNNDSMIENYDYGGGWWLNFSFELLKKDLKKIPPNFL